MQKLLLICGLMAMFGLAALPARAEFGDRPFGPPGIFRPQPLSPFNFVHPFAVTQPRWQVVVVPAPGQGPFILLVDAISGASYLLRSDPQQPAGYAWQLLDRQ